ncbi:MAG: alpha/beta fold hydrolase [Balneolaceae bacterium]|nr:MAG: alpha/beta fold hydrolase [Balneolaceae bacterium]
MKWIEPKKYLKKLELTEYPQPDLIRLKYPVLMCHGYGGFSMLVSPSPMHNSCMRLRSYGIESFAPNIVPYATIEIRAKQWAAVINELKKKYGYDKLNVVAHSMGGLDMRYAISKLGAADSVASLTTIAAPHRGTSLAELVLTAPDTIKEKLAELVDWFGESIFPSQKSDAVAAVEQLTREYVEKEFNPNVPDVEGIPYFSYSAAVGKGTKHPLNPLYILQNQLIYQQEGENDSFVTVDSAKWGKHLKKLDISHLEQIEIQVSKDRKPKIEMFWKDLVLNLKSEGL